MSRAGLSAPPRAWGGSGWTALHGLLDLFGDVPRVNDPRLGWVEGELFARFVQASHEGLFERQARVEHRATTTTAGGAVEECSIRLVRQGIEVHLPVAIAAPGSNGILDSVHVYHSMWPLMGAHRPRAPILLAIPGLRLPDVVARYHDHLARGDASGVVAQFEPDGALREALGDESLHRGSKALRGFFERRLGHGGILAEACAVTDDGTSCALEYNVTTWGKERLPHQAGITVYERATSGLLSAVRVYDDVEPAAG